MLRACSGQDVVKYTEANKCVISGLRGLVEGSDAVGHYRLLVSSQCAWLKQPVELEYKFYVGAAAACKILVRLHDAVRAIGVTACFYVCYHTQSTGHLMDTAGSKRRRSELQTHPASC
jgi:hypothetical protein